MTEPSVTHEMLRAGQMALIDRFGEHERHVRETNTRIFERLEKAIEAAHANHVQLTAIDGKVNSMVERGADQIARLGEVEGWVRDLQAAEAKHTGERGVWSALARSPVIMAIVGALLGAAAAVWTAVKSASAHIPMVTLALLITASLTGAVIASPVTVVSVHDGDTLAVKGQWAVMDGRKVLFRIPGSVNVRLLGIDTPEMGARAKCQAERDRAERARDNLRVLAQGKADIGPAQHDKYGGRLLADIKVNGVSLSAAQIAGGHAVAYSGEGPKKDWCT